MNSRDGAVTLAGGVWTLTRESPDFTAFPRRSVAHGGLEWTSEDVQAGADVRLYRATADSHWILAKDGRPDHRIPVPLL